MAEPSVAVVGAGLAGLSAVLELAEAGVHVEVFERSRLLGGRATSFELDGHVVDNGQHVFLACCTEFIRFVERAGMADALFLQDRFDVAAYGKDGSCSRLRAAALPAPLHVLVSFAGYAHLPLRAKIDVVRALLALRFQPRSAREDCSFAQWLRDRRQSAESVRGFWEPFLVPALNAPLECVNAAEAAFVLSTAFLRESAAARFGFATVPLAEIMERAARRAARMHRSCAVHALEVSEEAVVVRTAQDELRFDACIAAVSPRALARLVPGAEALGIAELDGYRPFAIMDAHLWHDGPQLAQPFAALLDSPVQWIFQKAPGYLCASISAADEFVARPSLEVAAMAWERIQGSVPALRSARLVRAAATRNPEGTFLAAPGVRRPGPRTAVPAFAIAGAWTATGWPDTMESAVRSGIAAAKVLLESNLMTGGALCLTP